MRLEDLYRITFVYPEGWAIGLDSGWEQHFYLAEGRCEGALNGRFRAANFPQRRSADGPFVADIRGIVETDDGATVVVELRGYGRLYPADRRQIVGSVLHTSDDERYAHLNDVVCACAGEVRAPADPDAESPDLVIDVAQLVWEPVS